jgi:hypothetical protein
VVAQNLSLCFHLISSASFRFSRFSYQALRKQRFHAFRSTSGLFSLRPSVSPSWLLHLGARTRIINHPRTNTTQGSRPSWALPSSGIRFPSQGLPVPFPS